jgi:uncharacterized protein
MTQAYETILETANATRIFDTHEHLRLTGDWSAAHIDLETLCRGYLSWAVPEAISPSGQADDDWWARLAPRLPLFEALAFYRSLRVAFADLYGMGGEGLTRDNWRQLSAAIHTAHQDPGWTAHVFHECARIDRVLHDRYWQAGPLPPEGDYLLPVLRLDAFLSGYNREARDHDGNSPYTWLDTQHYSLDTLDGYLDAIAAMVAQGAEAGAPCLKLATAYSRDLKFAAPDLGLAAQAFGRAAPEPRAVRAFEDAVLYTALEAVRPYKLPVQVHTGLAKISGSNPLNFVGVIEDFPDLQFVLFHAGYPWVSEAGALAFTYPNVWPDLVWAPIISPSVTVRALREWLDLGLGPRICWGGDVWTAEEAYGAALLGRQCISRALAQGVDEGAFTLAHANLLVGRILRENAAELYRLV